MIEKITTSPENCPFRQEDWSDDFVGNECRLTEKFCHECDKFPPDCPLFENDYLIKRRNDAVS